MTTPIDPTSTFLRPVSLLAGLCCIAGSMFSVSAASALSTSKTTERYAAIVEWWSASTDRPSVRWSMLETRIVIGG